MITEIVSFHIPEHMTREDVVALYESTVAGWKANPDLLRKNYLYDPASSTGGGVYTWKSIEAAKESHGEAFCARISDIFGAPPEFAYFETPVLIENEHG